MIQVIACQNGTFDVGDLIDAPDPSALTNAPTLYDAVCDARLMQQAHNVPIQIVVGPYTALLQ